VGGVVTSLRVPSAKLATCVRRSGCVAVGALWAVAVVDSCIKSPKKCTATNRNTSPPPTKKNHFPFCLCVVEHIYNPITTPI